MEKRLAAGEGGGEVPAVEGEEMASKGETQPDESVDEERPAKGRHGQLSLFLQRSSSSKSLVLTIILCIAVDIFLTLLSAYLALVMTPDRVSSRRLAAPRLASLSPVRVEEDAPYAIFALDLAGGDPLESGRLQALSAGRTGCRRQEVETRGEAGRERVSCCYVPNCRVVQGTHTRYSVLCDVGLSSKRLRSAAGVGDVDGEREQRERASLQVSHDLSLEGMPGVEVVLDCCVLRRL